MNEEKEHIVGIKVNGRNKPKTYYYKTTKDYKRGDELRVVVPTGGSPKSRVVIANSKKAPTNAVIKTLREK